MTCLPPSSLLGGTSRNRDPRGAGDVYTQYFTVTPTLVLTRRFLLEHYAAPHEPSSQRVEGEFTPSTSLSPPQWFWLEGSSLGCNPTAGTAIPGVGGGVYTQYFTVTSTVVPNKGFLSELYAPPREPRSQGVEGEFTPSASQWFLPEGSSLSPKPHCRNQDPGGWRGSLHPVPQNGSDQRVPP